MKLIPALAVLSLAWHTALLAQESSPQEPAPATVKRGSVRLDADGRMHDDFTGTLAKWGLSEDNRYELPENTPARIDIVDAPDLPDRKAVRFFVPREPNHFRAEISLRSERGYQERWYSERILVPKDWVHEHKEPGNDIVMQWHGIPGNWKPTFPNLEISIGGDHWHVRESHGSARNPTREKRSLQIPVVPGKWTHWVIHAKWSPTEEGLIRIWKDHQLVFERKGPNVYGDIGVEYTPYLKTGIYHPEWNLKNRDQQWFDANKGTALSKTVYVADFRMADGRARYEDMVPADLKTTIPNQK